MNIKHVFKSECTDLESFENCLTLDAYLSILKTQETTAKTTKYMKHGFEALIEAIILDNGSLRIRDYVPRPSCDDDLFVHGVGNKKNGKKVSVMVCQVEDDNIPFTSNANHLTAFTSNSVEKFGVEVNEPKGMRIFSNAKSLHQLTHEQFFNDKTVEFCLKSDIEKLINSNEKFWKQFRKAMRVNIEEPIKISNVPDVIDIKLRDFQKEASQEITTHDKGQVILPTGTGKTLIATNAVYKEIQLLKSTNKSPCILIMSPRIVLTYQLLGEIVSYFKTNKTDAQYLNLNSGVFDDDSIKLAMAELGLPVRDIPSTTTIREMEFYYDKAVREGVPFIVSATYQSAPRIAKTKIPIHMAIHDEAHNLVVGRFSTNDKQKVLKINAKKKIFLTATPAYSKDIEVSQEESPYKGLGMENVENYGPEIFRRSPRTMIDAGEIVPPCIHLVNVTEIAMKGKVTSISPDQLLGEDMEKNVNLMASVVEQSFDEHLKQVKERSCSPDKIGAKMIVVCSGDPTFRGFFKGLEDKTSTEFTQLANRKDIKFFGISSYYGAWIDGKHVEPQGGWYKEQFMLALKSLKPEDNAIIFHIDMLGEGIDLVGVTGVLPFRELGTIKSCQTLGRAMRIVPQDRESLYHNGRLASDRKSMLKPYAWVIIPVYSVNHIDIRQRLEHVVNEIRTNYEYKPSESFIIHTPPTSKPTIVVDPSKSAQVDSVDIEHVIEDVLSIFEVEKVKKAAMEELQGLIESVKTEVVKEEGMKVSLAGAAPIAPPPPSDIPESEVVNDVFTLKTKEVSAQLRVEGDRFILLKGSQVRERVNPSCPECHINARNALIESGKIKDWVVVEDIECNTSSNAASVVIGSNVSGGITWKKDGKTLKETIQIS